MMKHKAVQLDKNDPLRKYRKEFYFPKGKIYLDGNSLGLLSKRAEASSLQILDSWKNLGIEGWTEGENSWFYLPEKLATLHAPLVGAQANEIILTNSTTVNLHQLLATFYRPTGKKVKIVVDSLAFPSDIYAIKSHLSLHGLKHEDTLMVVKSKDGHTLNENDICNVLNEEVALVILPSVLYRSGQLLNFKKIIKKAHEQDILVGIDAAHSVGAVQHHFHDDGVDFAFWCTYKYLNGGPGSVGGLFVNEKHLRYHPGLAGWFSSNKTRQFEMSHDLHPADGAGKYQIGTPHIQSMSALLGSLQMFTEVGLDLLREKSQKLTSFMIELIDAELSELGFSIVTPRNQEQRGGHVAIVHEYALEISHILRKKGVIPDFRPPKILRLAPVAFYTSFMDVYTTIQIIKSIAVENNYKIDISEYSDVK